MDETISVRIPKTELEKLDYILKYKKSTKANLLREVLEKGVKEKRLEIALEMFQNNEATVSKAAKIAGIPLTLFLDILHKKGINFHYDVDDLREDTADLLE